MNREVYTGDLSPEWGVPVWDDDPHEQVWVLRVRDADLPFPCGRKCCGIERPALIAIRLPRTSSALAVYGAAGLTREELAAIAGRPGSENWAIGRWPRVSLRRRPEAGLVYFENGQWFVGVAGVRREGYRGELGGLYARWVAVPPSVSVSWS